MQHARAHYHFPVCDRGCSCYASERQFKSGVWDNTLLPIELQVMVILYLGVKDFSNYTSMCSTLYSLRHSPIYMKQYLEQHQKQKTYIKFSAACSSAFTTVEHAIANVKLYAHPCHQHPSCGLVLKKTFFWEKEILLVC
jgi:hypothetical protein